jgi:hypothetical protein
MRRRRKVHPADLANAQALARAVRFDVALFLGTGRFATATAATLEEARLEAARLVIEHPTARRPIIYGVTPEGRAAVVTS